MTTASSVVLDLLQRKSAGMVPGMTDDGPTVDPMAAVLDEGQPALLAGSGEGSAAIRSVHEHLPVPT